MQGIASQLSPKVPPLFSGGNCYNKSIMPKRSIFLCTLFRSSVIIIDIIRHFYWIDKPFKYGIKSCLEPPYILMPDESLNF
ncbi:Uncharacterised protein [Enterobacter cloacae]|nr:Uncharacterised protein [Enterobacter cloacae]